jgi:penicillin-binding protein 1A
MKRKMIFGAWFTFLVLVVVAVVMVVSVRKGGIGYMPSMERLKNPINKYASQIYSADGELIGTWSGNENRVFVPYDSISSHMFNALIATEDVRFMEHSGIDGRALGRAIIKRGILGNKEAGGGSTITQQLAKQLYSSRAENTGQRLLQKPVEWAIAVELEKQFTKKEIMTLYLNYFDFLYNAVGIKTAAKVYFNKHPKDLTLSESATLVGMCKNPAYYNPVKQPERTRQRRDVVFMQMEKAGFLTSAQVEELKKEPIKLDFKRQDFKDGKATYMREYLRQIMMAKKPNKEDYQEWQKHQYYTDSVHWADDPLYGWCNKNKKRDGTYYNIYTDGLKIYTSVDSRMQKHAENAVNRHMQYLQGIFNKQAKNSKNDPYSSSLSKEKVASLLDKAKKSSKRYLLMKESGASDAEIDKAFNTKTKMTVFSYQGDIEVEMTPMDSIKYYKRFLRSGLVSIDPSNGYIKAYVGGIDYKHFQYDMAMIGRRQVGSTMKPFVYSLAMQNGWTPSDLIVNKRRSYNLGNFTWRPKNGSHAMYGQPVTLKWGLTHSNNWITAELMYQNDPTGEGLVELLHDYGVANDNFKRSIILCLGAAEITVGEMASGYTAFVNKGMRCAPILVTRIEDAQGKVYTFPPRMNSVISEESSYKMIDMMKGVAEQGTGRRIRNYGINAQVAAKTGTTNDNVDGWFVGCVPKLVTACWVGGEERDIHFYSTSIGQGAATGLPIWSYYMKSLYDDPDLDYSQSDKFVYEKTWSRNKDVDYTYTGGATTRSNNSGASNVTESSSSSTVKEESYFD